MLQIIMSDTRRICLHTDSFVVMAAMLLIKNFKGISMNYGYILTKVRVRSCDS